MTYLVPLFQVDAELAAKETRTATLFKPDDGIPAGSYGFLESYCPDPDCDCRRVMINVVEEKQPTQFLASIGYLPSPHRPDCPVHARIVALNPPWLDAAE